LPLLEHGTSKEGMHMFAQSRRAGWLAVSMMGAGTGCFLLALVMFIVVKSVVLGATFLALMVAFPIVGFALSIVSYRQNKAELAEIVRQSEHNL
jgi:lipopolysaccharide export LptBFGC system permease protein LptF